MGVVYNVVNEKRVCYRVTGISQPHAANNDNEEEYRFRHKRYFPSHYSGC